MMIAEKVNKCLLFSVSTVQGRRQMTFPGDGMQCTCDFSPVWPQLSGEPSVHWRAPAFLHNSAHNERALDHYRSFTVRQNWDRGDLCNSQLGNVLASESLPHIADTWWYLLAWHWIEGRKGTSKYRGSICWVQHGARSFTSLFNPQQVPLKGGFWGFFYRSGNWESEG